MYYFLKHQLFSIMSNISKIIIIMNKDYCGCIFCFRETHVLPGIFLLSHIVENFLSPLPYKHEVDIQGLTPLPYKHERQRRQTLDINLTKKAVGKIIIMYKILYIIDMY